MDEESCTSKEEGSFHLSNWKKLIYIIAEIEKNVVEDSQQPQSQNIKEERLSNSRWSWPWKIHEGKVISSKIDAATKTIGPLTIAESLNNKQVIGLFYSRGTKSVCFNSSSGQEGTQQF